MQKSSVSEHRSFDIISRTSKDNFLLNSVVRHATLDSRIQLLEEGLNPNGLSWMGYVVVHPHDTPASLCAVLRGR